MPESCEGDARKNPANEPEWFATSIVKRPACAEVGPSYAHPSLVNVARIRPSSSPPQPARSPIAVSHRASDVRVVTR